MIRKPSLFRATVTARLVLGLTATSLLPIAPLHAQQASDPGLQAADEVLLNFVDTDLDAVVRALGHFTGRHFLVDPRVKGQLTLVSERPVARDVAYRMLLGALRMQGFAVVEDGGISKVVPEADAKLQGGQVTGPSAAFQGDQLVTRVFNLRYENAANLVPVLRPMIAPNNPISAYPGNNTLVITDYAANLARIAQVIASIDTPGSSDSSVVHLEHAVAADVAEHVAKLLDSSATDPTQRVTVSADTRTNSLILRTGSPARTQLAIDLIQKIDAADAGQTNIHVVSLRNAEAVQLAEVLRGVLTGQSGGSGGLGGSNQTQSNTNTTGGLGQNNSGSQNSAGMNNGVGTNTPSTEAAQSSAFAGGGAIIQADPSTNTLIITAPPPLYRNLRTVIDKLDVRRPQVFVETLIVEVMSQDVAEFGIQWMAGLNRVASGRTAVIGGNTISGTGGLLNVASNPSALQGGFNLGIINGTVNVPGIGQILNLGFLARALETRGNANILSTPNLMTLNNEEATIMVGQNLPFLTGRYTQSGSSNLNPFQTIERQDVGLQLRVRPQVSEGGTIKLEIHQEVSSVDETASSASRDMGVVTNKRQINTSVLVEDGQIIVLGGLLEDRMTGSRDQVPGLGDVPVVGNLFRYDAQSRVKNNLMVFMRPYVVRNADASQLTAERYDLVRNLQGANTLPDHWLLPEVGSPLLPPRIPGAGDVLPMLAQEKAPEDMAVIARDPSALFIDYGANVLLVARVLDEEIARNIATAVDQAGYAAYIEHVRPDNNPYWQVYVRVARDTLSTDTAIAALRQMGHRPELLIRP